MSLAADASHLCCFHPYRVASPVEGLIEARVSISNGTGNFVPPIYRNSRYP